MMARAATAPIPIRIFFLLPDPSESSSCKAPKDGASEVFNEPNVGPECAGPDCEGPECEGLASVKSTALFSFAGVASASFAGAGAAADPEADAKAFCAGTGATKRSAAASPLAGLKVSLFLTMSRLTSWLMADENADC